MARRILDSLTPGWQQVGAVWLPLPHLLNMLPAQLDVLYRTGASAVVISVASTGVAAWAIAWLILQTTASRSGAATAVALAVLNPNVLYLQSTPMTESLLFGTTTASLALTAAWIERGARGWPHAAGAMLSAACLTRYE
ncbi:MAG: family 2 glycosyl transferase, partial [Acidobacteriota bacterium]|nr:family 2 glycosyl transferase [Acidobacteriota bacterium]